MVEYLAGFVGTVVMTMMILFGDRMGLMPPQSQYRLIVDGMGGKMNEMMGVPKEMAWAVHFGIGTILHPVLIDILDLSFASEIVYALVFAGVMIMMLSFMGAPSEWKSKMSMGIIMAHLAYVIIFELLI
ncbi:MAG: hypothetical protein HeimC2_33300 [Candidatus Heimdallarchaeota archaeon LC_2]|nr:MAG: hypothetical protein HeimC2_34950 [Candidatus Heimdallarchaeota archaeon LC_2]OLS21498.1 MAG: hypothetical protein HeimC2_33300 [Candidatus Heimdallarchaeota archaeon LC_2]